MLENVLALNQATKHIVPGVTAQVRRARLTLKARRTQRAMLRKMHRPVKLAALMEKLHKGAA